jgi:type IX secretion system PorP/SprF family membrane protein
MRFLKSILSLIVLSLFYSVSSAQQVPMYSQYILNGFLVNPSFAGRDGYTTVTLTTREQWVGLEQSPGTYAASFQTRILKNSYISKSTSVRKKLVKPTKGGKVGLGGYIFNDNNGIMRRTGFQAIYAYHIQMGQTGGYPNNPCLRAGADSIPVCNQY